MSRFSRVVATIPAAVDVRETLSWPIGRRRGVQYPLWSDQRWRAVGCSQTMGVRIRAIRGQSDLWQAFAIAMLLPVGDDRAWRLRFSRHIFHELGRVACGDGFAGAIVRTPAGLVTGFLQRHPDG